MCVYTNYRAKYMILQKTPLYINENKGVINNIKILQFVLPYCFHICGLANNKTINYIHRLHRLLYTSVWYWSINKQKMDVIY